jgi:HEAT repeat protein
VLEAIPRLGVAVEPALLAILADRGDPRRHYVPRLLVEATGSRAAATLVALLDDADDEVAMNAATTLGALHDSAYADALRAIVDDGAQPSLRRGVAASALGTSGAPGAYETLAPLLGAGDEHLFAGAVDGLAELGDPRAIPLIQAVLAGGGLDERTARGAKLALISLRARR